MNADADLWAVAIGLTFVGSFLVWWIWRACQPSGGRQLRSGYSTGDRFTSGTGDSGYGGYGHSHDCHSSDSCAPGPGDTH